MVMAKNWGLYQLIIYRVMYMPGVKILDFSQEDYCCSHPPWFLTVRCTARCGWFEPFHERHEWDSKKNINPTCRVLLPKLYIYIYHLTNLDFPEISGDFPPNLRYLLGEIGRVSGRYNLTRYMYIDSDSVNVHITCNYLITVCLTNPTC